MVDITGDQLAIVKDILQRHVPDTDVWVFGSRAKGNSRRHSDLDLVIMSGEGLDWSVLADMREEFQESDLPFRVDVADWARLSAGMRTAVLAVGEKIQVRK